MSVVRGEFRVAATRALDSGYTPAQSAVLAYAGCVGTPLDPTESDDAAILLRAETLVIDGVAVSEAIRTARHELATWGFQE